MNAAVAAERQKRFSDKRRSHVSILNQRQQCKQTTNGLLCCILELRSLVCAITSFRTTILISYDTIGDQPWVLY